VYPHLHAEAIRDYFATLKGVINSGEREYLVASWRRATKW